MQTRSSTTKKKLHWSCRKPPSSPRSIQSSSSLGTLSVCTINSGGSIPYSPTSPVYSPTSPAYSDSSATPANSHARYNRPPSEPRALIKKVPSNLPVATPNQLPTESVFHTAAREVTFHRFTPSERQRALHQGYLTNISVSPQVRNTAKLIDLNQQIISINRKSRNLINLLTVHCAERENISREIKQLLELQWERKRAEATQAYSSLLKNPELFIEQFSKVSTCSDQLGNPIKFAAKVEIYSPFFQDPISGTVVQLEEDNIVLVHIERTGKIGGFFGTELIVKEISV